MKPSEYYRKAKPEFFSDTTISQKAVLSKELIEFQMSRTSDNQKQDNFERLCFKLGEKFITPNLIPQVGPTGGGDGKTDSETYPVDEKISSKWYTPKGGATGDSKWALAFSSMKDWRKKVRRDVKSIVGTNRNYTKIIFISSQKISSKNQKEYQDKLKVEFKIEVTILDETWIVEKLISNNMQSLFANVYSLSTEYQIEDISIGPNDLRRKKEIEQLEEKILDPERYLEVDFQIIEDALEAALISRYLEEDKDVIQGKFERAKRFAIKINSQKHLARILYFEANTYFFFYDDFKLVEESFFQFKHAYEKIEKTIDDVEHYSSLITLIQCIEDEDVKRVNVDKEVKAVIRDFSKIIENEDKPTSSCRANILLNLRYIMHSDIMEDNNEMRFESIRASFKKADSNLDFPFRDMVKYVRSVSKFFVNSKACDLLIDDISAIAEKKQGDLSRGELYLERGFEKLDNKLYSPSIVYFGKSFFRLGNGGNERGLFHSLMGLSQAYSELGLKYAAINAASMILSIKLGKFYKSRKLDEKIPVIIDQLIKYEIKLGRVLNVLMLYELYEFVTLQLNIPLKKREDKKHLYDDFLAIRIYQDSYLAGISEYLPKLFSIHEFSNVYNTSIYLLNQEKKYCFPEDDINDYIQFIEKQPLRLTLNNGSTYLNKSKGEYQTTIVGCKVFVHFDVQKNIVVIAESLLAFLESIFATRSMEVFSQNERVDIFILLKNGKANVEYGETKSKITVILSKNESENFIDQLKRMVPVLLEKFIEDKFFASKGLDRVFDLLYKDEEIFYRFDVAFNQIMFHREIFGDDPKILLSDWVELNDKNRLNLLGVPREIKNYPVNEEPLDFENLKEIRHDKIEQVPFIDDELWGRSKHSGFGFGSNGIFEFLYLAFFSANFARSIFEDIISRHGKDHSNKGIKISIVTKYDKLNPFFYRVVFSPVRNLTSEKLYILKSRAKTITPDNDVTLKKIIEIVSKSKTMKICPAEMGYNMKPKFYFDLMITVGKIDVVEAWTLTDHHPAMVGLQPEDNPIVPVGVSNPPYLSIRNRK